MPEYPGFSEMRPRVIRAAAAATIIAWVMLAGPPPCAAKVFLTQQEALVIAFPDGPAPERITAYLTDAQIETVKRASGEELPVKVITYYAGAARDGGAGDSGRRTAWFDTHLVRTMPETLMVIVSAGGVIERVDILSFDEPTEYLPRPGWTGQFAGRGLDEKLSTRQGIHPISGATLSARAIVSACRRVLALRQVLQAAPGAKP